MNMSCTSTWISYGGWIWPWTTWMRILLSHSMWILVKPACIAALIPFGIAVASAIKIDKAPKLNANSWINFPSQLRMMKPPAAPCDDFDQSKFILMNSPCGFLNAIQCVFFRLMVEKDGMDDWIVCVRLCLIRHFACAFFALVNVVPELGISIWNTMLFLVFHILHSNTITLSIPTAGSATLVLLSIWLIPKCALKGIFMLIQVWKTANLQQSSVIGHSKNRRSKSSVSDWQNGQQESIVIPLWAMAPLVGSDAWKSCQRKKFCFGWTSNFLIQLYSHTGGFTRSNPWAAQVAISVENWPLPESP